MGKTGIVGRLDRIEASCGQGDFHRLASRLAAMEGISETELLAEAERIARICRDQGITSLQGMIQHQADEIGITVEELEAEIERVQEQVS